MHLFRLDQDNAPQACYAGGRDAARPAMTDRFLPALTRIYSSLSPRPPNYCNANHAMGDWVRMELCRKVQHAVADALFHWSARGYGDPAFGWSAIIAGE